MIESCNINCSFCFLNYTDVLTGNYLFRGLTPAGTGKIIKEIHHQVRTLEKGEVFATEGDRLNHLAIIVSGSVVGEMMDFDGKILRVEQLSAPETVATAFLFGEESRLPVTITAVETTKLLLIHKNDLVRLFNQNNIVMQNFLDIISDRAQFMSRKIKLMSLPTIKGKISLYLLDLLKKNGMDEFRLPHSQQELSEIFGVSRPSVGRSLREMHRNGCIESRGKRIRIVDRTRLSMLISGSSN